MDRILNAKKAEIARVEAAAKADSAAAAQAAASTKLGPKQTAEYLAQLKEVFPDCDPAHLMDMISKETQDHVRRVTMKLLDAGYPKIKNANTNRPVPPVPGSFPGAQEPSNVSTISTLPPAPVVNTTSHTQEASTSSTGSSGGGFFSRLKTWGRDTAIVKAASNLAQNGVLTGIENSGSGSPTTKGTPPPPQSNPVIKGFSPDYQQNLQKSLKDAVSNCRSNGRDDIKNEPTVSQVSEVLTSSYCDVKPGHQLNFAGHAGELELYLDTSCDADSIMTKENLKSLARFVKLLMVLAQEVFQLQPSTMHVYFDPEGSTIAFNRGGALFFNWRYYVALGHDEGAGVGQKNVSGKTISARDEGMIYWFFTMAHELAHNFVGDHNSQHEVSFFFFH